MDFNCIYASYEPELKSVDESIHGFFSSTASLIPLIGRHIIQSGGKRIRPLFLLAVTDLCGYKEKNRITLAGIIEVIHTASLLHDDVVDSAKIRRGRPTSHSLWGNQIVILVGDFLYSNALRTAVYQKNQEIMERLSTATTRMTEGELLQLSRIGDPDITEEEYLSIIAGKTGALISAACSIGAIVSGATNDRVEALAVYGLKVGMAFQMTDDILDYSAEQDAFGKKLGKDMEEGKITLPMIRLMEMADTTEKEELKDIITSDNRADFEKRLERVFELFKKYDIINVSMEKALHLIKDAKDELNVFDSSYHVDVLKVLADYALVRDQ